MSLYPKRSSEIEVGGVNVVIENGNNPALRRCPKQTAPTTAKVIGSREVNLSIGDKILKVMLSRDGQHLEIEYLVKSGSKKAVPTFRMAL